MLDDELESLWNKVAIGSPRTVHQESSRERDGSSVRGFDHLTQKWHKQVNGYDITAIKSVVTNFSPKIDDYEVTRRLDIIREARRVCKFRKVDERKLTEYAETEGRLLSAITDPKSPWERVAGIAPRDLLF